jgi:hypothetical protein
VADTAAAAPSDRSAAPAAGFPLVTPGCPNVPGIGSTRHRLGGHTIMKARPTTCDSGMVPLPGSDMWPRES